MAQFSNETRTWLKSLIRQRKQLIRLNKNRKPVYAMEIAIEHLEKMLGAYSYDNDVNMAIFIEQNSAHINSILPGRESSSHESRLREYREISRKAFQILLKAQSGEPVKQQLTFF